MAGPRHERLEQLFLAAVEKTSPGDRAAFLEEACGSDVALRTALEQLLEADARGETIIDEVAGVFGAAPERSGLGEQPGVRIGRYRILRLIGEGGFGSVYLAEQEEPVRREVALKVIKLGMDTRQVIARFEAERQALALMDHPNIARVLDAGATDAGRPYFVMELVRGKTITEYSDHNRLTPKQRLELFLPICHAVQHAHQKGIIHRDIKPNNVLVTSHDGWPVPKVIDFGIARLTSQRLPGKTRLTEFGQFIGTPEYMSPEEIGGADVDTRTDVYSLGVLLYELLTGSTPLKSTSLREIGIDEIKRMIREVDPEKPSTRLAELASQGTDTGVHYSTSPVALTRMVRGDLDWIVMKSLEKERDQRYQAASELAADVERHLNNEPVLAGAPSAAYKLRKFVRRNRGGVAAGIVVAAALLGGLALATIGFVQATRAKAELETQRDAARASEETARHEAAKFGTVHEFLQEMLSSVDPRTAQGRDVTVREVMDQAAARIGDGSLRQQPEVETAVRLTIGKAYDSIGLYSSAEEHLRAAEQISQANLGDDHPETLRARSALAGVLSRRGRYPDAEELYRRTAKAQQRILGGEHPDTLHSLDGLGVALWRQKRDAEAEQILREVCAKLRRVLGSEHSETLRSQVNLATALLNQGEYAEAERLYREVLAIDRRLFGNDHPATYVTVNNLALALERQGKLAQAEPLFREALKADQRLLGPAHPGTQIPLNNLLRVLSVQGKVDEMRLIVSVRNKHIKQAALQPGLDAITLNTYAWSLLTCEPRDLRDPQGARPIAERAVELDRGNDANILDTLALAYWQTGDLELAIKVQQQAIARARRAASTGVEAMESRLLTMRAESGDPVAKAQIGLKRLAVRGTEVLAVFATPGGAEYAAGLALLTESDCMQAESALRSCLTTRKAVLPETHWLIADTQSLLGTALTGQGRFTEAESLLLEAVKANKENPKVSKDQVIQVIERLIDLYESWDKPEQVAEWRARITPI